MSLSESVISRSWLDQYIPSFLSCRRQSKMLISGAEVHSSPNVRVQGSSSLGRCSHHSGHTVLPRPILDTAPRRKLCKSKGQGQGQDWRFRVIIRWDMYILYVFASLNVMKFLSLHNPYLTFFPKYLKMCIKLTTAIIFKSWHILILMWSHATVTWCHYFSTSLRHLQYCLFPTSFAITFCMHFPTMHKVRS